MQPELYRPQGRRQRAEVLICSLGGASEIETAGSVSEAVRRVSEAAGRVSEAAGRASETAKRAYETGGGTAALWSVRMTP